jgi:hypothetical protein
MLACNLNAISADQRPRYNELVNRLRSAVQSRTDLPDGYTYHLKVENMTLLELAEWITIERVCCPFLSFHIDITGEASPSLTLRGPGESKAILNAALSLL